jgi:hypothetical protein
VYEIMYHWCVKYLVKYHSKNTNNVLSTEKSNILTIYIILCILTVLRESVFLLYPNMNKYMCIHSLRAKSICRTVVDSRSAIAYHSGDLNSHPNFIGVHVAESLLFCVLLWRTLFYFWSLYCVSFKFQLLITSLVSSNDAYP